MSNSSLATYKKISPNRTSPRNHAIDTISIHCAVCQKSAKDIVNLSHFVNYDASNGVSCNYAVGNDGSIAMCVEEKDRSWCTSSRENDHRAITIEVASDTKAPYKVTDKAYKALIELLVDICKRNKIKKLLWKGDKSLIGQVDKQNMTVHRWFANKSCPGDYLYNLHGKIAEEVNKKLGASTSSIGSTASNSQSKPSSSSALAVGTKLDLKNVALYASASAKTKAGTKTGTYYVWSSDVVNNRIRITNSKTNVGKSGQVTGWIALSTAKNSSVATSTSKSTSTSSNEALTAGTKLNLKNVALYVSASAKTKSGTKTGTYYIWDNSVINNRIRITNIKSNVGKSGKVTGWIASSTAKNSKV